MKRDFLKALNLDDSLIDKILDEHSRGIGAEKAKTEAAATAKADLEAQLTQRDKDLTDLKKAAEGNEALTKQLNELQEASKAAKTSYETAIRNVQLQSAIKLALSGKVHDTSIVSNLIDASAIELDADGNVKKGLDTQIEALAKDKAFLFVPSNATNQNNTNNKATGYKPAEGSGSGAGSNSGGQQSKTLQEAVAAALSGNKT